ncbi:FAD-binding protein [Cellulomonas sp. zg-ZUI188]|uniref:FAD-binding protein n=2 Tax=Cellulomonas fengjieae TaxID=2819978 RepID=A0ABS3SL96_9CELL|nr:FAD-binding protein [Cellulomonas fengjieae]QVI66633.1 FAD-binding protein [Cellulomonas fengjieae]
MGVVMLTNWAGNYTYGAAQIHHPRTVEELQETVAGARRIRALGTRHCFNDLADGPDALVALDGLESTPEIDAQARTVTVTGGTRYGTLAQHLHPAGWAVHNLASLPHISVAGAVATGTHGSGDASRNLAGAVAALEIVGPDGALRTVRRGDEDFAGSVVALGALGVVTRVTLDIEPTYDVAQEVHVDLPWPAALEHLDEITGSADSVSLFTDWTGDTIQQVWRKSRVTPSYQQRAELFGATPADGPRHPLPGIDPVNCTAQLGEPGPWHDRLPHFRMDFTPSNGDELQSEFLVPRAHAVQALEAVRSLGDRISPLLQVTEVRTMAGDDLWLSGAQGGPRVGLHFTWRPLQREVTALLPTIEAALAPFDARPHWGKLFADEGRDLARLYPHWDDFRALVARTDPEGVFRNAYLERHVL